MTERDFGMGMRERKDTAWYKNRIGGDEVRSALVSGTLEVRLNYRQRYRRARREDFLRAKKGISVNCLLLL